MREYKFKYIFKNKENKKLDIVICTLNSFEYGIRDNHFGVIERLSSNKWELIARLECIGLTDNRGKEIYVGDIIRKRLNLDGEKFLTFSTVEFGNYEDEHYGFFLKFFKEDNKISESPSDEPLLEDDIKLMEVIGNIYENPELLK